MCGIAGVYLKDKKAGSKQKAEEFANALLLEIENRGRQATGFVSIGWDKSVKLDKADKTASEFIKEREEFQDDVQAFLLHTRLWTKGRPEEMGNNHPVSYNNCFAVHNGSIWNDDELFEEEKLKRNFQVDSEIIPALLNKYGVDHPDKIKTALEKLGGPLAIAAIDIRLPSRLVLAKGQGSPLYVFENQSVIVWASTHSAIREAWGKVIGTPPKADKIKYFKEGMFAIADDYKELGFYEFKPKERPKSEGWGRYGGGFRQTRPYNRPQHEHRNRQPNVPKRPWDSDGPFNTRDLFLAAVREHRQSAEKRARLWLLRESYEDSDFEDVIGDHCWVNCICGHSALINDTTTHAKYGLICNDCYAVITEKYKANAIITGKDLREPDRDENDPFEDITIPDVPPRERSNLESWAEIEARFHRTTLAELSDYTGLTPNAIDFLVFRTPAGTSSDFGLHVTHLKFKLKTAYDAVNEYMHTEYGKEILAEVNATKNITQEAAQDMAEQQGYPWRAYNLVAGGTRTIMYACETHNERFPYGLSCGECVVEDVDLEAEVNGDHDDWGEADFCGVQVFEDSDETATNLPLERCGSCGVWFQGDCPDCGARKRPELPAPKIDRCCCRSGSSNRKCRRKLAFVVHDQVVGKPLGYCSRHWEKCSSDKCQGDAIFLGEDGARWCHTHSRRKQGIADAYALANGNNRTIQEVK